ncbi:alpha-crystallin B chain [Biomphalaria pfeifferi]|uniref:Alpha-crystallin B chain n=1 Tax=Biomphalaria pfeifferi TaxID=112525 RepID=A0AAD8AZT6_BIOPF|nr:alpha-crystallin B chain [Biomphalaria pfeifferi]
MYKSGRLFQLMPRLLDDMSSQMASMLRLSEELNRLSDFRFTPRHLRQSIADGEPEIHNTDKEFNINLELPDFKPEDVKITSDNNRITINAKREEKLENNGYVCSEITRTYSLPEDVDPKTIVSAMNRNGILKIVSQKKDVPQETPIPIDFKSQTQT